MTAAIYKVKVTWYDPAQHMHTITFRGTSTEAREVYEDFIDRGRIAELRLGGVMIRTNNI